MFSGDMIQLYARANKMSLRAAASNVRRLVAATEIAEADLEEYVSDTEAYLSAEKQWPDFQDVRRYEFGNDTLKSHVSRMWLSDLCRLGWDLDAGQMFGLATGAEIGKVAGRGAVGAPKTTHVVSRAYSQYGRLSGYAVYSHKRGERNSIFATLEHGDVDSLLFMNAVMPFAPEVFYIGDPCVAAAIQAWSYTERGMPAPVLGYFPTTANAFACVSTRAAYFWHYGYTDQVFVAARNMHTVAHICSARVFDDGRMPLMYERSGSCGAFMSTLRSSAKPYLEALRDYLLDPQTRSAESLLSRLKLTGPMRESLLSLCPNEIARGHLEQILTGEGVVARVRLQGSDKHLVRQGDSLFVENKKGQRSVLSHAVPVIDRVIVFDAPGVPPALAGSIYTSGKVIPFVVPRPEFTPAWMDNVCTRHANPLASFTALDRDFLPNVLSLQPHKPQTERGQLTPGWDSVIGAFRFRTCTIPSTGAAINEGNYFLDNTSPTARGLFGDTEPGDFAHVLTRSDAAAAFWRVVCAATAAYAAHAVMSSAPRCIFGAALGADRNATRQLLSEVFAATLTVNGRKLDEQVSRVTRPDLLLVEAATAQLQASFMSRTKTGGAYTVTAAVLPCLQASADIVFSTNGLAGTRIPPSLQSTFFQVLSMFQLEARALVRGDHTCAATMAHLYGKLLKTDVPVWAVEGAKSSGKTAGENLLLQVSALLDLGALPRLTSPGFSGVFAQKTSIFIPAEPLKTAREAVGCAELPLDDIGAHLGAEFLATEVYNSGRLAGWDLPLLAWNSIVQG